MKIYLPALSLVLLLVASCNSGHKLLRSSEDKDLLTVIRKLEKNPSSVDLRSRVKDLYQSAAQVHLDKIENYKTQDEVDRWPRMVREYEALQQLSQIIASSPAAGTVTAPVYADEIKAARQNGAEAYYLLAQSQLDKAEKLSFQEAYRLFRKANELVPNYRDVRDQIKFAFENGVVKVVINPVRDNTYFYNSMGWNNYGNNYNNDYFQRSLVSDLGGYYNRSAPALFYTDWDARRENIQPDWEVNLTWQYINIPQPLTQEYTRSVSRQIETGRDTAGKVQYQKVSALLRIVKKHFTASGDMELRIVDLNTGRDISNNRYTEQYNWSEEYATYTGDSRAISGSDLATVNNGNYRIPRNEDVLNELSRRIYPQIKSRISSVTNWQ